MRRKALFSALLATAAMLHSGVSAGDRKDDRKINVDLTGFDEVRVVVSTGNGGRRLTVDESA